MWSKLGKIHMTANTQTQRATNKATLLLATLCFLLYLISPTPPTCGTGSDAGQGCTHSQAAPSLRGYDGETGYRTGRKLAGFPN
jgi:hypothetical protein